MHSTVLEQINPQLHAINSCESQNWSNPWRMIYDQQLLIIKGARIECAFEGSETIICEPDSFIIKPAGVQHRSIQLSKGSVQLYWVHFDWTYTGPPMTSATQRVCRQPAKPQKNLIRYQPDFIPNGILHGPLPSAAEQHKHFERMQQRWICGTPTERAGCRALFLELLIRLLGDALGYVDEASDADFSHKLAIRTREILNRMLENPKSARVPLRTAFEKLGYSYPHICRTFKQHMHCSPLAYYNQKRMEQAEIFLRETSLPINEIASNVGIDNPSYFSRLFVAHFGKSPQRFRNIG